MLTEQTSPGAPVFGASVLDQLEVDKDRPLFDTSLTKLALLSVATLGLYQIYWFYRHWRRLRDRSGDDVIPILRAIFGVLFCGSLASRVREKFLYHDLETSLRPNVVWARFFVISLASVLPGPYELLAVFSFLPLLTLQREINRLHQSLGFPVENQSFGVGGWVVLFLGAVFWSLVLVSFLSPEAYG